MTVRVPTPAGCCSNRIPLVRKSASTVSLWTRSPRMVSGSRSATSTARAMASFTPKHIPKCSARMIFIIDGAGLADLIYTLYHKVKDRRHSFLFKRFLWFVLPDDLLQQGDVFREGFAAGGGQRTRRQRTFILEGFCH